MLLSMLLLLLAFSVACGGGDNEENGEDGDTDGNEAVDGDSEGSDSDTEMSDSEAEPQVASKFYMGYSDVNINPPLGTPIGGYGVLKVRWVEGVHDDLMAQVAFFKNDVDQAYIIVSIDNVGYFYDFGDCGPGVKALRETIAEKLADKISIVPQAVTIASSHSHYTTDLTGFWQETESCPDKDLLEFHVEAISDAVLEAYNSMQEIKLFFGETEMEAGYAARDALDPKDPESPPCCNNELDQEISIIQAQDLEGTPLLTIANYSKHPCHSPWETKLVSADYIYGYREEMQKKTGAPAMFMQGFEAAVHDGPKTRELGEADNFDTAYAFGVVFADTVEAGFASLTETTTYDIMHKWATFESQVGKESAMVTSLKFFDLPKRSMHIITGEDGEDIYVINEMEVSWHRLGDAEFALYPGEATPRASLFYRSKMVSPYKFLVCLANDSVGYLLEQEDFDNDPTGRLVDYELTMGIGYAGGPDAKAAMDSINWYDGAWQEEAEAE